MNEHTLKFYGEELAQLKADVARLGGLAEAQLNDAVEAVARRDVALAQAVVGRDEKLDLLQREIEKKSIRMIALSQPVAQDLRRIRPGLAEDRIRHGDIVIDRVAHRVKRAEREIHLGPTEFRLLDYFMQHPGRVFSREQLLDAVWGSDVYVETRTVDVHVGRLRKALNREDEADPIRTVRSAGYSLDSDALA